jgi:hypothetical protein
MGMRIGIPGPSTSHFHIPGSAGGEGGEHEVVFFPIGYNFYTVPGPSHPGPVKATELVKVLSDVDKETMEAIDLKIRTEEKAQNQEEMGWKCGICLQGLEDDEPLSELVEHLPKEMKQDEGSRTTSKQDSGVKTTPCNHLFHGGCLQPWFERHLSW